MSWRPIRLIEPSPGSFELFRRLDEWISRSLGSTTSNFARSTHMTDTTNTLDAIRAAIQANRVADREPYEGLSSADIGRYNRAIMFGDDDEAFPSDAEWSAWVD